MNPITSLFHAMTHPTRAASTLVRATVDTSTTVATAGFRAAARAAGWAAGSSTAQPPVAGAAAPQEPPTRPAPVKRVPSKTPRNAPSNNAPSNTTAAQKTPAKKAPAKKAARKAPSKRAAVVAPALGLSEAQVEDGASSTPEPLVDAARAKAVASESAVLRRAADVDKG